MKADRSARSRWDDALSTSRKISVAIALLIVAINVRARAEDASPPPASATVATDSAPAVRTERRNLKPVWVAGLATGLGIWALRAGITFAICGSYGPNTHGCDGQDYVGASLPVVGAWVQAAQGIGGDHGATSAGVFAAIVGAGVAETASFVFFVLGLAIHRDVSVRTVGIGPLHLTPSVGPRGLGVAGYF